MANRLHDITPSSSLPSLLVTAAYFEYASFLALRRLESEVI